MAINLHNCRRGAFIFLSAMLTTSGSFASDVCEQRFGTLNCSKGEVHSAEANGNAMVIGTTIKGELTVNGQLTANDAKLSSVTVNGAMTLENTRVAKNLIVHGSAFIKDSKIKGTAVISGHLTAEGSTFSEEISISGQRAVLVKCQTQELHFNKTNAKLETLELENTIVDGNVVFESKKGSIVLCNDSKILGDVIGANITEKDC